MQRRARGRPSTYSRQIADEICTRIAEGEPLSKICTDTDMPAYRTVLGWRVSGGVDGEFSHLYAHAREDAADFLADEIRVLAKRVERGELDPNAGRVSIDALKWSASKLKPRAYGDRLELAGQVAAVPLVDQAPDWLKAGIAERRTAAAKKDKDKEEPTVH